jgi:hypothetical protein
MGISRLLAVIRQKLVGVEGVDGQDGGVAAGDYRALRG